MMLDWNVYQSELSKTIPQFAKLSPDSLKGYQTLSAANSANSHLGEKIRQLISLAVAITTAMVASSSTPRRPSKRAPPKKKSRKPWASPWP
jgi:hypothetical protein